LAAQWLEERRPTPRTQGQCGHGREPTPPSGRNKTEIVCVVSRGRLTGQTHDGRTEALTARPAGHDRDRAPPGRARHVGGGGEGLRGLPRRHPLAPPERLLVETAPRVSP